MNSQPDCIQYQCIQILFVDCRKFKVGMDSCNIPGAIQYAKFIMPESLDTCEGARYSCYISADMRMMLCSFDQQRKYEVSLCEMNIMEAWNSKPFECFRNKMRNACPGCENGVLSSCEARFSQLGQKRTDRKISPFCYVMRVCGALESVLQARFLFYFLAETPPKKPVYGMKFYRMDLRMEKRKKQLDFYGNQGLKKCKISDV